jgi:hypothetical protein
MGCHLCEDMKSQLHALLDEVGFSFSEIFIDNNPALENQYGTLVPVLRAGEREICHYFLDLKALQQYMSEIGNPLI